MRNDAYETSRLAVNGRNQKVFLVERLQYIAFETLGRRVLGCRFEVTAREALTHIATLGKRRVELVVDRVQRQSHEVGDR